MGLKFNLNFNLKGQVNPKFNLKLRCFLRLKQEKVSQNAANTQIENPNFFAIKTQKIPGTNRFRG